MSLKSPRTFRVSSLLLALGLTQAGCQQQGTPEQGSSPERLLTASASLRGDMEQMRALAARDAKGSITLDLSDETQNRFLRARVAAAGKTPQSHPQFYAMLDAMRERHLERKRAGLAAPRVAAPNRDHLIGGVTQLEDGRNFQASAFSTIQDGADYSFLDVVVWTEDGNTQVSDYGWGEVYGDGRKLWAQAKGPLPRGGAPLFVDSASIISVEGREEAVFTAVTTTVQLGCDIVHPQDLAPTRAKDGIVTICLDRDYGDCDYPLVGHREVQIPLQGSFTFGFPVDSINKGAGTYAKLVEEGGGPHEMTFGSFGDYVQKDPSNPNRVTWSIPQHKGIFTGVLFTRYQDVDLFQGISVNLKRNGRTVLQSAVLSSNPTVTTASFTCLPKIQIVYSCLAQGTRIQLAGGQSAPVESIAKGSEVVTDGSGLALGVADTSTGIERIPMVRLVDDAGHDLLLTGSHPVVTPDRGVLWAEELVAGNQVLTESGVSTLVKASRETYHGTVHNLKLDTQKLTYSRYAKGSTMYANGFLVGDLSMQRAYEFKNSEDRQSQLLAKLPARWHGDYQNSLQQGTLTARR